MQLNAEQQNTLLQLLSSELATAKQFEVTLKNEYQALKQSNPETISEISHEKRQLIGQMGQQQSLRDRFVGQLGLPADNSGTERLLQNKQNPAHPIWQELKQVARRLKDQNEVNGGLIVLGQRHASQALEILSGNTAEKNTYGKNGISRSGASAHTLGKV